MVRELKEVEGTVFQVTVGSAVHQVEFIVEALPNDMKNCAFLAGELSNSAFYFSTFANVNIKSKLNVNLTFTLEETGELRPFTYKERTAAAVKVDKLRKELLRDGYSEDSKPFRDKICGKCRALESRQEHMPLVGVYVT